MRFQFSCFLLVSALLLTMPARGQSIAGQNSPQKTAPHNPQAMTKVPSEVILVKGAWSSASDSVTPIPEAGSVTGDGFTDEYFGIAYPLPKGWTENYKGPPPSDTGRYVLAQVQSADLTQGHILVMAQDMFFTPLPTTNALDSPPTRRTICRAITNWKWCPSRSISLADLLPSTRTGPLLLNCTGTFWQQKSAATPWSSF